MRNLLLLFFLAGGSVVAAPVPRAARTPPPKPAGPNYEARNFLGRVEYIDLDQIILKPEGHLRSEWTQVKPDGTRERVFYEQNNDQPARVFKFSDRLLTINGVPLPWNRIWHGEGGRNRTEHDPADVKIDDRVYISFGTKNGVTICCDITIMRRPGGRVPDAYGDDDPAYKVKISTERNAQQFLEETFAGKWAPRLASAFRK